MSDYYPVVVEKSEEGARRLELLGPLLYTKAALIPFREPRGQEKQRKPQGPELRGQDEQLFCFALDKVQSRSIEPDPAAFLGPLCAAGYSDSGTPKPPDAPESPMDPESSEGPENPAAGGRTAPGETLELPRGRYLFAQKREALDRDAVIGLAIEVQKDGLWERLEPEENLYVRFLYEDNAAVTQIFRPYRDNHQTR